MKLPPYTSEAGFERMDNFFPGPILIDKFERLQHKVQPFLHKIHYVDETFMINLSINIIYEHRKMNPADGDFIKVLTAIVEDNYPDEKFGPEKLASKAGISHSNLHRKLKSILRVTSSQFIRNIRLNKARDLIQEGKLTISEIAYKVGFGSPAYFNRCFHEYFGVAPGVYKNKTSDIQDSADPQKEKPEKKRIRFALRYILPIIFLMAIFFLLNRKFILITISPAPEKTIAVLPFKNLSGEKENQYFTDGVMEDIHTNLSHIRELKVTSETSVEQFRQSRQNIHEISGKLHVNYLLEGSVEQYGEKVRVRVKLIDARNDRDLFSETYDRDLSDIFNIQSEIAQKVAGNLQATLSAKEGEQIRKTPTQNMEAYKLYLTGRFFWNKRTESGLLKSVEYFEKAMAADSEYALAFAGLADAYHILNLIYPYSHPDGYAKAKELVLKALELDNNLAEAHATLGAILCYYEWKWEEARKEFLLAIEINPNYATGYLYYSQLLDILNDRKGARAAIERALALDPYSIMNYRFDALYYTNEGKLEKSIDAYEKYLEIWPENSQIYIHLFYIYYKKNDVLKGLVSFKKYIEKDTSKIKYVNKVQEIYAQSGLKGLATFLVELEMKKSHPYPYTIASKYAILEEKNESLKWFEKAFEERTPELPRMNSNASFKELRSEPRFQALIKKMGLSGYPAK